MIVLIHLVHGDYNALEYALEYLEKGNEVFILQCDRSFGICQHNRLGNPLICRHCIHSMNRLVNRLGLCEKVHLIPLSKCANKTIIEESESFNISFNSISELKNLTYAGAQLGYGAFSSYVTSPRTSILQSLRDFWGWGPVQLPFKDSL